MRMRRFVLRKQGRLPFDLLTAGEELDIIESIASGIVQVNERKLSGFKCEKVF